MWNALAYRKTLDYLREMITDIRWRFSGAWTYIFIFNWYNKPLMFTIVKYIKVDKKGKKICWRINNKQTKKISQFAIFHKYACFTFFACCFSVCCAPLSLVFFFVLNFIAFLRNISNGNTRIHTICWCNLSICALLQKCTATHLQGWRSAFILVLHVASRPLLPKFYLFFRRSLQNVQYTFTLFF